MHTEIKLQSSNNNNPLKSSSLDYSQVNICVESFSLKIQPADLTWLSPWLVDWRDGRELRLDRMHFLSDCWCCGRLSGGLAGSSPSPADTKHNISLSDLSSLYRATFITFLTNLCVSSYNENYTCQFKFIFLNLIFNFSLQVCASILVLVEFQ